MTSLRVAAALGLVLLVAGCGGGASTSTTAPAVSTSSATRPASTSTTSSPTTTRATPVPTLPAGGPVPAGFVPSSFTAISDQTWWLLGNASCSSPPCTSIVRTSNGGADFVGIPAPRAPDDGPGAGRTIGVWQLRFADPLNGFAYDTSMYVTHTGGSSWHQVSLGGPVTDLAIADGDVYASVQSANGQSSRLMRSPVGRDDWVVLTAAGQVSDGLWVHGTDVFVEYWNHSKLLASHDGGESFTSYPAPTQADLRCSYEEMQPPVVWAYCASGTEGGMSRSTDGGRSFRPADGSPTQHMMTPNSAAFAAASSTVAVVAGLRLFRTTNAGISYAPVGPAGFLWAYLGFTDSRHGAALAMPSSGRGSEELFYTTSAGVSYHRVGIG
jgi:hypothetical protein